MKGAKQSEVKGHTAQGGAHFVNAVPFLPVPFTRTCSAPPTDPWFAMVVTQFCITVILKVFKQWPLLVLLPPPQVLNLRMHRPAYVPDPRLAAMVTQPCITLSDPSRCLPVCPSAGAQPACAAPHLRARPPLHSRGQHDPLRRLWLGGLLCTHLRRHHQDRLLPGCQRLCALSGCTGGDERGKERDTCETGEEWRW